MIFIGQLDTIRILLHPNILLSVVDILHLDPRHIVRGGSKDFSEKTKDFEFYRWDEISQENVDLLCVIGTDSSDRICLAAAVSLSPHKGITGRADQTIKD